VTEAQQQHPRPQSTPKTKANRAAASSIMPPNPLSQVNTSRQRGMVHAPGDPLQTASSIKDTDCEQPPPTAQQQFKPPVTDGKSSHKHMHQRATRPTDLTKNQAEKIED
jgi:hypothetical protein